MDLNEDRPPSPADALEIIEREQARTGRALGPNVARTNVLWGAAYLVAGLLYFLYLTGRVGGVVTVVACGLVLAAAVAVGVVSSVRGARGVRPDAGDARRGALYGASWSVALVLAYVLAAQAADTRLIPILMVFVVGLLYLMQAVVWPVPFAFEGGVWIMLVAVVAAFLPSPAHVAALAVGAGGGLVVVGLLLGRRAARR